MNLAEKIIDFQNTVQDNFVLIEYDLFFNNIPDCCIFAIDDHEELEKLNDIIVKIRKLDKKTEIYVCTYIIDFSIHWQPIYADNIWIDTAINIKELEGLFAESREIEPCNIVSVADDDTLDGIPAMVFLSDGTDKDYSTFIKDKELSKVKSLYWD